MTTEVATQKLFFDAEKTKLVLENDPEAKILAAAVGDEVPEGFKAPAKASSKAESKMADPPDNKGSGLQINKETDDVSRAAPAKKQAAKK